ncbi:hypothetical protein [Pantoea rodasii]|uniref:hypothetical protein n=1 Tax=Pantoea rodasii TaxID=1076549 RepID=UPI000B099F53|nr:hypothetical protein [Pantoea rodasii]
MKWILVAGALLSSAVPADDRAFETPEIRCLNDHTIPLIPSNIPAKKVVDDAYAQCKPELDEWMGLQKPLPDEMKQRMRTQLYEF